LRSEPGEILVKFFLLTAQRKEEVAVFGSHAPVTMSRLETGTSAERRKTMG
jgi:hypothetical protein